MMKRYTTIVCCGFFLLMVMLSKQLHAQESILQQAEMAWYKGDHFNAAKFYLQYITGKGDRLDKHAFNPYAHRTGTGKENARFASHVPGRITWRLAESYRFMFDYAHAEDWYRQAATQAGTEFPLAQYWYAVCLRANEHFTEAENAMNEFVKNYKGTDQYTAAAARELKNLQFTNGQLNKGFKDIYIVEEFGGTGVLSKGNFAPVVLSGALLLYTGVYTDSSLLKKKNADPYINRLYQTSTSNEGGKAASVVNIGGATVSLNQGSAAITPDGNTLFFTQWEKKNNRTMASLWRATRQNDQWGNAVPVSVLNAAGYNSMQPFVSADGKYLLFSSDKPGGAGGYDLWYALLENGQVKDTAINMGWVINTPADEETPFYAPATNRLVFSTNGRTGLGGFDLFSAKGSIGKWSEPMNMGYPLNSSKDDQYFYSSDSADIFSEAWFASDRGSDCCLELFTARQLPRNKTLVGTLLDCKTGKPLSRGNIFVSDRTTGQKITSTFTDPEGKYILPVGMSNGFRLVAEHVSYANDTSSVSVADLSVVDDINDVLTNRDICLQPLAEPAPAVSRIIRDRVIYFDFDKQALKPAAIAELDSMIVTLNEFPAAVFEVGGYTDEAGTDDYNIKLGLRRANAATAYLLAHGIDQKRISIKSYGKLYGSDKTLSKTEAGKWNRKVRMVILR